MEMKEISITNKLDPSHLAKMSSITKYPHEYSQMYDVMLTKEAIYLT